MTMNQYLEIVGKGLYLYHLPKQPLAILRLAKHVKKPIHPTIRKAIKKTKSWRAAAILASFQI